MCLNDGLGKRSAQARFAGQTGCGAGCVRCCATMGAMAPVEALKPARRRFLSPAVQRAPSALPPAPARMAGAALACLLSAVVGCSSPPRDSAAEATSPAQARARLMQLLPPELPDRSGWASDIYAAFAALQLAPTPQNLCAAIAVTEQESSFHADPVVPGLGAIARKEIDRQADRAGVPRVVVGSALQLASPDGRSYFERIDAAKSERELSAVFEDFIGMLPLGSRLLAARNPVRTGGPMQVSIAYAEAHAAAKPYPYPAASTVRHEVFTRRGGLYFGIAHLLDYPAQYDRALYRYADFNAGQYASRNAAFQSALSSASGLPLELDGDLLRHGSSADEAPGSTELATRVLAHRIDMREGAIRRDLERGQSAEFSASRLYERVFALAERLEGRPMARAVVPRIALKSPKFTRKLTTEWFAKRVDDRAQRCLARAAPTVAPK